VIAFAGRHRYAVAVVTVLAVAAAAIVWFWFAPQKLLIDERVDEALPTATPGTEPTAGGSTSNESDDPAEPVSPRTVATGMFASLGHETSGTAAVVELADGTRILRFENLRTDNGPDLKVYLSPHPADAGDSAFGRDFVDLGKLKGNLGDQNYEIPTGTDLEQVRSVVIWCRRFAVGFGVAPLA
jgi:hypothetical protein